MAIFNQMVDFSIPPLNAFPWLSGGNPPGEAWIMATPRYRRRDSLRAPWHDYRAPGAYFVTICIAGRARILSRVERGRVLLSDLGRLVRREWVTLPRRLSALATDAFVVMPDHLHGILWVMDPCAAVRPKALSGPPAGSISAAVGQFKSRVTKAAVAAGIWPAFERLWQRGFHDRILRTPNAVIRVRRYIELNPIRWETDR
jgi:REP element-mobilizing transposase RayT